MQELLVKIIADGLVVPIVLIGAAALLLYVPNNQKYQAYCRILMAGLTAYIVAKLIGAVFQPEVMRPFEKLGTEAGASFLNNPGFPSDHVLFCMAITLAVWFEAKKKLVSVILLGLTLLVGIGRILALVHTPLDVLGGLVIACVGIPWYFQRETIKPLVVRHQARKKHKKHVK
ncbi:MAG TPA: phosphatase PAP2 family protein [Candidatus Saccharimonadales bacterium]